MSISEIIFLNYIGFTLVKWITRFWKYRLKMSRAKLRVFHFCGFSILPSWDFVWFLCLELGFVKIVFPLTLLTLIWIFLLVVFVTIKFKYAIFPIFFFIVPPPLSQKVNKFNSILVCWNKIKNKFFFLKILVFGNKFEKLDNSVC